MSDKSEIVNGGARAEVVVQLASWVRYMGVGRNYDVSPDGERFLMIKESDDNAELILVQNWVDELKRLVPSGN